METNLDGHDPLTAQIIGAAIDVHRALGPGLLESVYEQCLVIALQARGLSVQRQVEVPVEFMGVSVQPGYRIDLLVEGQVIVEIKAVEKLLPVHEAQVLTYLKQGGGSATQLSYSRTQGRIEAFGTLIPDCSPLLSSGSL